MNLNFLKNRTFVFKINFYILSWTLIIFISILIANYFVSKEAIIKDIKKDSKNLTLLLANEIDKTFLSAMNIADNLAITLERMKYSDEEIHNLLKTIVKENDEIFGCCIAYEPYAFLPNSHSYSLYYFKVDSSIKFLPYKKENDYFKLDWYSIPQIQNKAIWTEPYYDSNSAKIPMVSYSVPFYKTINNQKILQGIVSVSISLDWVQALCSSKEVLKTGFIYLLSSKGTYISHPNNDLVMKENILNISKKYDDRSLEEAGYKMLSGKTGLETYFSKFYKKNIWLYYAPLYSNRWPIVLFLPEDELFSDLEQLTLLLFLIGIVGITLLYIIITSILHRMTSPLMELSEVTELIGSGNFDVPLPITNDKDEIGRLSISFNDMQKTLKEYIKNLKDTTKAKEAIESELSIARRIQQSIVPHEFPAFPDRPEFDLFAILEPAKAVGGDLYDYFFIDKNTLIIAIGDVSGKGVPASLLMAITKTLLRSKADNEKHLHQIITEMNKEICEMNENSMFVTLFLGKLDLNTGVLEYFNAAHNPPYIIRKNHDIEKLDCAHGTALGFFIQDFDGHSHSRIYPGDKLILYTDGVTEAMDCNLELYGEERFEKSLNIVGGDSKEILSKLLIAIREFTLAAEQSDDITLLSLTFNGYHEQDQKWDNFDNITENNNFI